MTSHEKITDWNSQNLQAIFFIDPFYEFPPSYRLDIWWVGLINVSSIYYISLKIHPISNPNENFLIILHRNRNIYSKIYTEPQKVPGRQKKKFLNKMSSSGEINILYLNLYYKQTLRKTIWHWQKNIHENQWK